MNGKSSNRTRCFHEPIPCVWFSLQLEEEISTLRQVLTSKERQQAELRQKLGISPLSDFKNNVSKGWHDMQTSVA